jgi:hypothetical protein
MVVVMAKFVDSFDQVEVLVADLIANQVDSIDIASQNLMVVVVVDNIVDLTAAMVAD